jgi:hypothetical protein
MYITSASLGLTHVQRRQWPLPRAVSRRESTAPGLPAHLFTTGIMIKEAGDP